MKNIYMLVAASWFLTIGCTNKKEEVNHCSYLDQVDLEMLNTHKAIKVKYSDDPNFLSKLMTAQVAWTQYKDRHVNSLFPKPKRYYENSDNYTEYKQCKCKEWARLTKLRNEELKTWLKKSNNFSNCPSSIK